MLLLPIFGQKLVNQSTKLFYIPPN